jgi:hypothetical protein
VLLVECKPKRESGDRKEDFYWPEDFVLEVVVWVMSGKKCPAWPAVANDPLQHMPEVMLNSCIPDALCVMFFAYSAGGQSRVIYLNFILYEALAAQFRNHYYCQCFSLLWAYTSTLLYMIMDWLSKG